MTLLLDAGAFIAVERADRSVMAVLAREHRSGRVPLTHGGVAGQVRRGDARQARVARLLCGTAIAALDATIGRAAGALMSRSGTHDVSDAAIVVLASDGDEIHLRRRRPRRARRRERHPRRACRGVNAARSRRFAVESGAGQAGAIVFATLHGRACGGTLCVLPALLTSSGKGS